MINFDYIAWLLLQLEQMLNSGEGTEPKLPSLAGQDDPEHCLKAVLCAILADYSDRPDDYEHQSPVAFGDYEFNTACI